MLSCRLVDQEALGAILMKRGELRAYFEFIRVSCCVWMCACVVLVLNTLKSSLFRL